MLSGVTEWNALWKMYSDETDLNERRILTSALCQTQDPSIVMQ